MSSNKKTDDFCGKMSTWFKTKAKNSNFKPTRWMCSNSETVTAFARMLHKTNSSLNRNPCMKWNEMCVRVFWPSFFAYKKQMMCRYKLVHLQSSRVGNLHLISSIFCVFELWNYFHFRTVAGKCQISS